MVGFLLVPGAGAGQAAPYARTPGRISLVAAAVVAMPLIAAPMGGRLAPCDEPQAPEAHLRGIHHVHGARHAAQGGGPVSWLDRGWEVFPAEPSVVDWLRSAGPAAVAASRGPALRETWLRHGGTWFVGVDALPNRSDGRVGDGPPLAGRALEAAFAVAGRLPLHRAQVSVTYPGYPRRDPDESASAHRFRRARDAAHLDGLLPAGPEKRRHLREMHAFILGFAATDADAEAAPLVVWEGSHGIIRSAFAAAFKDVAPDDWPGIDMTGIYKAARRDVFERCARRVLPLRRGQAVLVHRHAIHGVAPWAEGARAAPEGRATIYFRPEVENARDWLDLP
jgi:hypothetical protein